MPEALVRRRYFTAMRQSAHQLWGDEGLARIAEALPDGVRTCTLGVPVIPEEWLPATTLMAWLSAVWETTACRDPKAFRAFVDLHTQLGFGRVRSLLLSHATPETVLARAPTLWRDDNSAGDLLATLEGPTQAIVELRHHVYATASISRLAITELVRSILSRCRRVRDVTARAGLLPGDSLQMHFTWVSG